MPRRKGSSSILLKVLGLFLILAVFLILLLPRNTPPNVEKFSQPPTGFSSTGQMMALDSLSGSVTNRYAIFDNDMKKGQALLQDQFNLLLAKRCYQFHVRDDELSAAYKELEKKSIPVLRQEFTYQLGENAQKNRSNTETAVFDILEKFKTKLGGKPIKGPIFAIVSQVPYYRNDAGGVLPVQFYAEEYHLKPYNVFKDKTKGYVTTKVVVLFPAYEANSGSLRERILPEAIRSSEERRMEFLQALIIDILKDKEVIRRYCFLECADNPSLLCGCYSEPNQSSCLAPKRDANTEEERSKPTESHYVVMYSVNKKNAQVAARGLIA